jgi:hypothetical protein
MGKIRTLHILKLGDTIINFYKGDLGMTLKQQKIDVTDRVVGKMKNGEMELFLDNTSIGKIQLPGDMTFQLDQRFEVEQRKIFQNVTVTEQPNAKYTDCDDGGWC